jgi:hypothetical protein
MPAHLVWAWQHGGILYRAVVVSAGMALLACLINGLLTHWSAAITDLLVAFLGNTVLLARYWRDKATILAVEVHALQNDLDQRDQRPRGVDWT